MICGTPAGPAPQNSLKHPTRKFVGTLVQPVLCGPSELVMAL